VVLLRLPPQCKQARLLLERLLEGRADAQDRAALESHLEICSRCAETLGKTKHLAESLEAALKKAAEELPKPVLPSLPPRTGRKRVQRFPAMVIDFSLLLLLGVGLFLLIALAVVSYRSARYSSQKIRTFRAVNAVALLTKRLERATATGGSLAKTLRELQEKHPSLRHDPWGRPYVASRGPSGFLVYSVGANGLDEGGHGDDITLRTPVPSLGRFRSSRPNLQR